MKKYISLCLTLCLTLPALAQREAPLRERIYIQTDKPSYLAGETVWIKAITTDPQGRPLALSRVAYIELLDNTSPRMQIKIEMKDAIGEGSFIMPLTLPGGHYRLTAYTRYMRNEGESIYYDRLLPVINPFIRSSGTTGAFISNTDDNKSTTDTVDTVVAAAATTADNKSAWGAAAAGMMPVIATDRAVYTVRASGELSIEGIPEDIYTLSLSIAGIDSLTVEGSGPPNVVAGGMEAWRSELAGAVRPPLSAGEPVEYEGHILTGLLVDTRSGEVAAGDKPIALLAFAGARPRLFGGQVDGSGKVSFFTHRSDGVDEMVTAVISSSTRPYRLDIQSPFAPHTYAALPALSMDKEKAQALLERSVGVQVLQSYADSITSAPSASPTFFYPGEPDWSYMLEEYTRFPTMAEVVIEFIPGLRFRKTGDEYSLSVLTEERSGFAQGRSLVLLDGIPIINHTLLYNYNPLLIKSIEVYKGKYVFGEAVFDGMTIIRTHRGNAPDLRLDSSTQIFSYQGAMTGRDFPFPVYQREEDRESRLPDYRHTLLWKPQLTVSGSRILIPFTTSDIKGDFLITLEGLTKTGHPIHSTALIKVAATTTATAAATGRLY
ncbi:MAG: hypothetical protein LBI58_04450 [Tannerellaceae bacterium]|nr:hypothetical protein [Tannerellaceae bacterium]